MSEKVAAPLSSSSTSLNMSSVGVFISKLPYHILLRRVGRAPYNNLTGRRRPKGYLFQFRIDYCTLFSTFDMDKLKKNQWKNTFKLEKLQSLKVGFVENQRRYSSSKSPNFTDVCMVGAWHKLALPPPHPPRTEVCQFWQLYRAISLHA